MNTLTSGQGHIPHGLAAALAGHYAQTALDGLARLHWTGFVLPGTEALARQLREQRMVEIDVQGQRDPNAVAAELRALEHYCRTHVGLLPLEDWMLRRSTPEWVADSRQIIPWGWKP